MSGQTQLQEDVGAMAHSDDSVLLAYIRQQSLGASWSHIDQHISGCPHCRQRSIDLIAAVVILTFSVTVTVFNLFHVSNYGLPIPFHRSSITPSHDVTVPVKLLTATAGSSKKTPGASHPTLQLCQVRAGKAPLHISICGSPFTP